MEQYVFSQGLEQNKLTPVLLFHSCLTLLLSSLCFCLVPLWRTNFSAFPWWPSLHHGAASNIKLGNLSLDASFNKMEQYLGTGKGEREHKRRVHGTCSANKSQLQLFLSEVTDISLFFDAVLPYRLPLNPRNWRWFRCKHLSKLPFVPKSKDAVFKVVHEYNLT